MILLGLLSLFGIALMLVVFACASGRIWIQIIATLFAMAASTVVSIWVLQLGWLFAAIGLLMILGGGVWRLLSKAPTTEEGNQRLHPGTGLVLPGLGLLAAPFLNVFVLMPILRSTIT